MEDSQKEFESSESADESNRAPGSKATGRIDLQYTKAGGAVQRWSLIEFDLPTKYDARSRTWRSEGDARSNTRPQQGYKMKVTYDESDRILTITLQNYVFTVPSTHVQAGNYNDRSTLNISFLRDAEGSTDAVGDQYLIKGGSRLNLSL
jgi:hypothetical protein